MALSTEFLTSLNQMYFSLTSGIQIFYRSKKAITQQLHEISNHVLCATNKASDQHAHMRCLIRAFASRLNIL